MRIINVFILFILLSNSSYSQENTIYHYVLNEHIVATDSIGPLFGMEQEFTTERKYYSPLMFSETRLFTGDTRKAILYKIENGVWYHKQKSKWKLFYDYNKMVGGSVLLSGVRYNIKFENVVNVRNAVLHKIALEPIALSQSHKLVYYFNPLKGVVIIKSNNAVVLLRSDDFKSPLTSEEMNLL